MGKGGAHEGTVALSAREMSLRSTAGLAAFVGGGGPSTFSFGSGQARSGSSTVMAGTARQGSSTGPRGLANNRWVELVIMILLILL